MTDKKRKQQLIDKLLQNHNRISEIGEEMADLIDDNADIIEELDEMERE